MESQALSDYRHAVSRKYNQLFALHANDTAGSAFASQPSVCQPPTPLQEILLLFQAVQGEGARRLRYGTISPLEGVFLAC